MDKHVGGAVDNLNEVIGSGHMRKGSVLPDVLRGMSKNQRHKLVRYGKVPGKGAGPQNNSVNRQPKLPHPTADIGETPLTDHLFRKSRSGDDAAQYLYKEIVKRQYPFHSRSFDTAQRLWERVENSKVKKKGGRPSK